MINFLICNLARKSLIHKTSQYSTIHAIHLLSQAKNKKIIIFPQTKATAKRLAARPHPIGTALHIPNTVAYTHTSSAQPHTSPIPQHTFTS